MHSASRSAIDFLANHNVGEDRFLVFGLALVLMMLLRPGGLFPKQAARGRAAAGRRWTSPFRSSKQLYDMRQHDDETADVRGGQVA